MTSFSGYPYLVGYLLVYFAVVSGVWVWQLKRQRERPPVSEKLIRGPAESLRRQLDRLDRTLLLHLTGSALVPLLVLTSGLWLVAGLGEAARLFALIGLLVVLAGVLYGSAWWLLRVLRERRELKQRWFSARAVAEAIEPLRARDFRVFHDVPATEATPPFTIDHLMVGPSGVFVLKTITQNKRKGRPGLDEHKIIFDGHELIFPWGDDARPLGLVREPAAWLDHWLVQLIGRRVPVQPVLVYPGWWVEDQAPQANVRVTNPLQVAALAARRDTVLTQDQIDLIAKHLESRCRDVEY
jgi:hypothetical protein